MTVRVRVDWSKDGTFGTAGDDVVTDDVRAAVTASYGRDPSAGLSTTAAGMGGFALDNSERRYSPRNTASPLYGRLKPARPVLIERTVEGSTFTILRAASDSSPINPDIDARTATVKLVDSLAAFRANRQITTPLYQGVRTGTAIGYVLDAAGWTGGRDLDAGATIIPWWWEEGADVLDALQKLVASEGSPALLTMGPAGEVVFRDRHHRLVRTRSTTSQSTWRGTEGAPEPVMARPFSYDDAWGNVINSVSFSVAERQPQSRISQVWITDELIYLSASESRTVVIQTADPFFGAITPRAGTDYEIQSGSLSSVSLSRTSGAATSITITAGGSGCVVAGMALPAYSVPVVRTSQVSDSDSTSMNDYEPHGLPSGMEPVWAGKYDAQALAKLYVLQRKQPLPVLQVTFRCGRSDTKRLAKLLALDLSDRVTVVEPESAVNGPFFIEHISHTINHAGDHEIVFMLEAAPSAPGAPFIIGTSVIGTGVLAL